MAEIAIVGAGPAGVAAAVTAARAGAAVTLIDEYSAPGGQYFKQPASGLDGDLPPTLAENIQQGRDLLVDLNHEKIDLRTDTLVWNVTPDRKLSLYSPDAGATQLQARKLIIASGAYERLMPFPGWTLPGVMTVGGAQLLLKGQRVAAGRRVLLAGTGPLLQLAAVQLLEAGSEIVAIVELQSRRTFLANAPKLWGHWAKVGQGMSLQVRLKEAGVPTKYGHTVVRALGEREVTGAVVAQVDGEGRPRWGAEETLAVDTICLNYGFVPATELTRLAECEMYFDAHFDSFATRTNENMETTQPGIFAAGEVRGIGGVDAALLEGRIAGAAAARQLGYTPAETEGLRAEWQRARAAVQALGSMFALQPGLCELATDEVIICRCEEVTAGEIRAAVRAGVTNLNQLKPWTRAGMGRCQGRICGPIVAQLVAREAGLSLEAVDAFTARPPVKPVPMNAVARPVRHAADLEWEDHVGYGRAVIR